jgi:hypothetical protein
MRVSANDLISIAKKLHDLEKLDINITEFELHGNICTVTSTDDQKEGRSYFLTNVTPRSVGI